MSKKTHEKELARARAKRAAERAAHQRTRRVVGVVIVAVVAIAAVAVGFALQGDDTDPVAAPTDPATGAATELFTDPPTDPPTGQATDPVAVEGPCPAPTDVPEIAGTSYESAPEMVIDPAASYTATVETTCGTIVLDLFAADAPLAVNSFVFLAREGFYDGVTFHRVIEGFMIQGGDPTGSGSGGPGYQFEDELDTVEKYGFGRGMLAMANSGPATNGSQFFIVQGDASHLTTHTVFGEVTEGMEVVDDIAASPVDAQGRPAQDVAILSIEITETPAS